MFVPHSSTNTKRLAPILPATNALQAALRNSSRSAAPTDLFSAPAQPLEHPADGGVTYRNPGHFLQELAPLGEGGRRTLFEIRFQEPACSFAQLRLGAGALLRSERLPFAGRGCVALDGGDAHAEGAGDFDGGRAPYLGLDDLLSQVQRVRVHFPMMPYSPGSLQTALGLDRARDPRTEPTRHSLPTPPSPRAPPSSLERGPPYRVQRGPW